MRVICIMCKCADGFRWPQLDDVAYIYSCLSYYCLYSPPFMLLYLYAPMHHIPSYDRPSNSETHFKVIIISTHFQNKTPIAKHRLVNSVLKQELDGPVHALSIVAMTPDKWDGGIDIGSSPSCRGGDGSLPKKSSAASD